MLKQEILSTCQRKMGEARDFLSLSPHGKTRFAATLLNDGYTMEKIECSFFRQVSDYGNAADIVENSKVIMFSAEQAMVFSSIAEKYTESLDYKLPFSDLILQFDKPINSRKPLSARGTSGKKQEISSICALALRQVEMTRSDFEKEQKHIQDAVKNLRISGEVSYQKVDIVGDTFIQNVLVVVFSSLHVIRFAWQSGVSSEVFMGYTREIERDSELSDELLWAKNLATACIGYINCENIYLEQKGGAPEKVNRKREAKGKSRLEPYYVCRIRGVNYDSVATGTGSAHHIRYDVRGHFRRLTTGKTTWVRPHQRGLQNELYIPKTYKVEKGSKPAWNNAPSH